jgi:hypothetical protein
MWGPDLAALAVRRLCFLFRAGCSVNTAMLAKVCSSAPSAIVPPARRTTTDGNGIEACPVELEANAGYGDTIIVIVVNIHPKIS